MARSLHQLPTQVLTCAPKSSPSISVQRNGGIASPTSPTCTKAEVESCRIENLRIVELSCEQPAEGLPWRLLNDPLKINTIDHVLYSVDNPFSTNETGKRFVDEIQRSKLMSKEDLEMFANRNAESLLKIKPINCGKT
jgi:hypothetical protein